MGKTAAQYQKEYRERKKKTDPSYLEKERKRAKSYRLPIDAISKRKQETIRKRNREYVRNFRAKKRLINEQCEQSDNPVIQPEASTSMANEDMPEQSGTISSSSSITTESSKQPPLVIKMSFKQQRRNPVKRSKALKAASYGIKSLKLELQKVTRDNERLRKRNYRLSKKQSTPITKTHSNESQDKNKAPCGTPRSKTKIELKKAGISPAKVPKKIKKKLEMVNAMIEEVREAKRSNKGQKSHRVLANIVSGKIMNKYKCIGTLSKATGISRKILKKATTKHVTMKPRKRKEKDQDKLKKHVVDFLERDDVSVNMPGKKDFKKADGSKKQTRVLNDYMSNLYEKFKSENPHLKISMSVFCRLRPDNILLTKLISRNTCLCSRHQNVAMKLKRLREMGIEVSANPETASKCVSLEDMKSLLKDGLKAGDDVEFEEWKRVDVDGKKKMKVVKVTMTKEKFESYMTTQYDEFLQHVDRVKSQYNAVRQVKENLPENEVVVHMDFAENFTCSNADEIQSAYWNSTAVTLHPVVVYHRNGEEVEHKSFIYVSEVTNHNSTAVYTILKKLVPELKALFPDLKMIHYWTDSPSSQYRNKYIFDVVLCHSKLFGVDARWNYFESGHGKGPCDGLGGIAKRQAGEACKQGKVIIQDAQEFYRWAASQKKSIEYVYYSTYEYESASKELSERSPKPVSGTMKLHAVFPKEGKLYTRIVSCYCNVCLAGELCGQWSLSIGSSIANEQDSEVNSESLLERSKRAAPEVDSFQEKSVTQSKKMRYDDKVLEKRYALSEMPKVDSYVLVEYDEKVYPGKVLEVDEHEEDARVSFMEESKGKGSLKLFKWPTKPDEIWVDLEQFICVIEEPVACGKTERQFKLHDEDYSHFDID